MTPICSYGRSVVSPYPPRRLHLILVRFHRHVFCSVCDVTIHLHLFCHCKLEFEIMELQSLNLNPCYRWIVWSCHLTSLEFCYGILLLLNLLKQWVVVKGPLVIPLPSLCAPGVST